MPRRTSLFALFALALNGCGTDCPAVTCDDLVNVVFSSTQTDDYRVIYNGKEFTCRDGQPSGETLFACGPDGFLLKSGSIDLEVSVQSENWSGSTQAILEPTEVTDAERPGCILPCFRSETIMMIEHTIP